jgi:hypothetical protein
MHQSAHQHLRVLQALEPESYGAGTENGADVDTKGFRECLFAFNVGVLQATTTVTPKIQESSDAAVADAYADVPDAALSAIALAGDQSIYYIRVNCDLRERYLRCVLTIANDTCIVGCVAILSNPHVMPVTQEETGASV